MFIKQLKYHLFFSLFFYKNFYISFSPNWFRAKRAQKKDGLKVAQDSSLAPYDR